VFVTSAVAVGASEKSGKLLKLALKPVVAGSVMATGPLLVALGASEKSGKLLKLALKPVVRGSVNEMGPLLVALDASEKSGKLLKLALKPVVTGLGGSMSVTGPDGAAVPEGPHPRVRVTVLVVAQVRVGLGGRVTGPVSLGVRVLGMESGGLRRRMSLHNWCARPIVQRCGLHKGDAGSSSHKSDKLDFGEHQDERILLAGRGVVVGLVKLRHL
jgi:hypothetical protein